MFVGKSQINYVSLKKKKRKKPADTMPNKAYVNSFCLSPCVKQSLEGYFRDQGFHLNTVRDAGKFQTILTGNGI